MRGGSPVDGESWLFADAAVGRDHDMALAIAIEHERQWIAEQWWAHECQRPLDSFKGRLGGQLPGRQPMPERNGTFGRGASATFAPGHPAHFHFFWRGGWSHCGSAANGLPMKSQWRESRKTPNKKPRECGVFQSIPQRCRSRDETGARERTRTSTKLPPLAPEASASTNSATRAGAGRVWCGAAIGLSTRP